MTEPAGGFTESARVPKGRTVRVYEGTLGAGQPVSRQRVHRKQHEGRRGRGDPRAKGRGSEPDAQLTFRLRGGSFARPIVLVSVPYQTALVLGS